MPTDPARAVRRVLPYDVTVTPNGFLGNVFRPGRAPSPPRFDELARAGLIAPPHDPNRWFSTAERLTADWLRTRGLDIRSVRRREGHRLKTPDAVAVDHAMTIESKGALATPNAIVQRIRSARWQARRVVVDLRGTGANRQLAQTARQSALRMYGRHLDEVILIVANDLAVGWTHG